MSHPLKPAVTAADHIQGNPDAPVTLVEYGDYECPHCGHAYPVIRQIQAKMGDQLKFVFRNFPLAEMHPHAVSAAVAAEAAGLQGKYFEMHDIIFENQHLLDEINLYAFAKSIGLDLQRFKEDIQQDSIIDRLDADIESGIRSGVNGTPSFFVNGSKYEGDWELQPFLGFLRSEAGSNATKS